MRIQELLNKLPAGAVIHVFLNLKELYKGSFRSEEDFNKVSELCGDHTVKYMRHTDSGYLIYLSDEPETLTLSDALEILKGEEVEVYRGTAHVFNGVFEESVIPVWNYTVRQIKYNNGKMEIHC
jgi:hypothetical protein